MSKGLLITIGVLAVIAFVAMSMVSRYNGLVGLDESIDGQWSQVENQYKRRADLIPNLVKTVKGYAEHEQETLQGVVEARAKATDTKVQFTGDPAQDAQMLQQFDAAQQGLSGALSRLMVVVERYPDLKANQNFLDLQAQLEGTENRIATERGRFNERVQEFNANIRRFPTNILAGMFGFDRRAYFEAPPEAEEAPAVNFGD